MNRSVDLLITDLDGTLYDWLGFYIPSFLALVNVLSDLSGIPAERLKASFKRVNEEHGSTEYAFAIQELDVLPEVRSGWSVEAILRKYDPAIHAFRTERRKRLRLYDGVRETLQSLSEGGVRVVAHSDSMMGYVSRRLRQLDVDELLDAVSAPEDHGLPTNMPVHVARRVAVADVAARIQEIPYSPTLRKPDPRTLEPILRSFGVPGRRVAYVGDSLSRDMALASRCGIQGIWARYAPKHPGLFRELLKITYWTQSDVASEDQLLTRADELQMAQIHSFGEVLSVCGLN